MGKIERVSGAAIAATTQAECNRLCAHMSYSYRAFEVQFSQCVYKADIDASAEPSICVLIGFVEGPQSTNLTDARTTVQIKSVFI